MKTIDTINAWKALSDDDKTLLLRAISTRGKYKGYLLANKPKDKVAAAVWNAIMMTVAPARCSLFSWNGSDEADEAEKRAHELMTVELGMAIKASEPSFRWNLFAHRYDCEKLLSIFQKEGLMT